MLVESLDPSLHRQLADLVAALRGHLGHRSVWIDPFGMLWHAEPEDEELDALGHRYVGTFLRPDRESLERALVGIGVPKATYLEVDPAPTFAAPAFAVG
jgi:hypothetical protein